VVPRQRAERMALNACNMDDAAAVLVFDGMLCPNVHFGAAATAGSPSSHLAGLREVHRDAMRAITGGRARGFCAALLEEVTGMRSVEQVRRRKLAAYVGRTIALPDGHIAKEILRAAREGNAMSGPWRAAVEEACETAGTGRMWEAFATTGGRATMRAAVRVNLEAAERAERAGGIRAGAHLTFQRHVAKVVEAKGRRLAPEAQLDEAHSATGVTFLRQARADMLRTNRNMFAAGGGRVNDGRCAVQGCGGCEDVAHVVASCTGWGLPEARNRWATAVKRTDKQLTYEDAVRIVALDESMAPGVTAPVFRRETLRLCREIGLARFGGRLT